MADSDDEEFLNYSNPHSWLLVADDLHDQAECLMKNIGNEHVTRLAMDGSVQHRLDRVNRAVVLLLGFAIENILKGAILFRSPEHLKDAKLSKEFISGHNLLKLAENADLEMSSDERRAIFTASEGIVSWARYPCATDLRRSKDVPNIDEKFLETLKEFFRRARSHLMEHLEHGWQSHLGLFGKFKFSDGF